MTPCPSFSRCGACQGLQTAYAEQLSGKREAVMRAFRPEGLRVRVQPVCGMPDPVHYRNKVIAAVSMRGPRVVCGLYEEGSHRVVPVSECLLQDRRLNRVLATLESLLNELKIRPYGYGGVLRHLLLRKAAKTGEILAALVTSSEAAEEGLWEAWKNGLLSLELTGHYSGILHIINDSEADAVKCDSMEVLYGRDYFEEEILGLKFRITPFSFFQTNSLGAELLYDKARSYIREHIGGGLVFDLYSGTGTIAQLLAPAAGKVVGVEIVEEAVRAAGENAKANGLSNCEFIAGDVLKVLDDFKDAKPDCIILDPPRDGVNPKALGKILAYNVDNIVYISCKPTSLARDMAAISYAGYRIKRWGMVDMFPFTGNVETAVLLSRSRD